MYRDVLCGICIMGTMFTFLCLFEYLMWNIIFIIDYLLMFAKKIKKQIFVRIMFSVLKEILSVILSRERASTRLMK